MVSATLVSSLVTRAEEISSPYVEAARQRSPLVDRTATKVVELAKQYEVESYVKKADELAEKAAVETLNRIPAKTKTQVAAALAKSRSEHMQLIESYASGKVDSIAASVLTLVDRMLPEDAEESFTHESNVENVKELPKVVYRRGNKAAQLAVARGNERRLAAQAYVAAKQHQLQVAAAARKEMLRAQAQHAKTTALDLVDELRDEFDQRTLPVRDAAAVKKAELQLRYKAALAAVSARRAMYTELAWAQLRERNLDVYVLDGQKRVAIVRAQVVARANEWRVVAAEKTRDARTLFVEQKDKIVAVTVNAKDKVTVQVVAVKSQLTSQYESVEKIARAKLNDAKQTELAQQLIATSTEVKSVVTSKASAAVEFVKDSSAPARARVVEVTEPVVAKAQETLALTKAKAAVVVKEAPAFAGSLTAKVLGEERGMQAEKQVQRLVQALPVVSTLA